MPYDRAVDSQVLDGALGGIADAIRGKTGKTEPLTLDQMPGEIRAIETEPVLQELNLTENGEYTPGEGVDGFSKVVASIESAGGGDEAFISVLEGTATDLVLPDGLVNIKTQLNKSQLKSIVFPDTLETIDELAFAYIPSLSSALVFPKNLKSIGRSAFNGGYKIPSITFKGTPETLHSSAFTGCSGIKVINAPWSEGEVADAPWGATNATINYNYVEG